jgi:TPR repeat protein
MPRKQDLPEALAPLSRRNAVELSETRFRADVNRLIEAIEKSLTVAERKTKLSTTPIVSPPESTSVRPPESKDLSEVSDSARPAEPNEPKEIVVDTVSVVCPSPFVVATAKDRTPPLKSIQVTPPPSPVPSTSSIVASNKPDVWPIVRRIVIGALVLLLLGLTFFLIRSHPQETTKQGNQTAIEGLNGQSKPPEAQLAEQGTAAALYDLGLRYQNGEGGVPKDLRRAAELYQKAADQVFAEAQFALGWLYESGQGVLKNLGRAAELYQKAADQRDARAQFRLGRLYESGQGVLKDLGRAAELYQKAADQRDARLGRLYESGQGVLKDLGRAAELYQKAADQRDARAQFRLGRLYESGQGVPKDLGRAAELYQKAADQGLEQAISRLKGLSSATKND